MIAANTPHVQAILQMPMKLDPARLDEGFEETLRRHNAKCHQSCRMLFNNTKLTQTKKRAITASSI